MPNVAPVARRFLPYSPALRLAVISSGTRLSSPGSGSVASLACSSTSKRSSPYFSFARSKPSAIKSARSATTHDAGLFTRCPSSSLNSPALARKWSG